MARKTSIYFRWQPSPLLPCLRWEGDLDQTVKWSVILSARLALTTSHVSSRVYLTRLGLGMIDFTAYMDVTWLRGRSIQMLHWFSLASFSCRVLESPSKRSSRIWSWCSLLCREFMSKSWPLAAASGDLMRSAAAKWYSSAETLMMDSWRRDLESALIKSVRQVLLEAN